MQESTVPHVRPPDKSLQIEAELLAARHALWLALFLVRNLNLHSIDQQLVRILADIDRRRAEAERP